MRDFPTKLRHVRDRAARDCLKRIFESIDQEAIVWPHQWSDRDDTNLLDSNGDYAGQSVATPVSIRRILLRACHNSSTITFALQELM